MRNVLADLALEAEVARKLKECEAAHAGDDDEESEEDAPAAAAPAGLGRPLLAVPDAVRNAPSRATMKRSRPCGACMSSEHTPKARFGRPERPFVSRCCQTTSVAVFAAISWQALARSGAIRPTSAEEVGLITRHRVNLMIGTSCST